MPRIEPIRLLNCLSVLLSPTGGIKNKDVIYPLSGLMTKYSKKLVSKCIYIQILKCTDLDLLSLFMGCGGWRLVHTWLTESIVAKNWPLVRELLELLLLCPVDIETLKTNNNPKLVKELSKDDNHFDIRVLASKLVEQWLKIVKGEQVTPIVISDIPQIIANAQCEIKSDVVLPIQSEALTATIKLENDKDCEIVENGIVLNENKLTDQNLSEQTRIKTNDENIELKSENKNEEKDLEVIPILKLSLKNGTQIISQVDPEKKKDISESKDKSSEKHKSKSKEKDSKKSSSSSSKSSSSKHSNKPSSSSDKSKQSSSKHNDSKEKSRDKDKDKHRHSSDSSKSKHSRSSSSSSSSSTKKSNSSSSSKSKDEKKVKEASDKDTNKVEDKLPKQTPDKVEEKQIPSIQKLGKIPKLSDQKKEKPSISIEVRKPEDPKPKTVKTFHSRFRKHGLEEEIKPPPSRASLLNKKPLPPLPPTVSIPKRSSPVHNDSPPEKKPKTLEINKIEEKPGSIKLIPAKPKPMVLQESDMFMDALNASATNKKEPKKRKRRTSGSKDTSPPHTPTALSSPNSESKSVPPRFYQDTLDSEENKEKSQDKSEDDIEDKVSSKAKEADCETESLEPHTLTINGLKGVLCYHKRKGPKKSIKWKPDCELEEVQYFELDETERVNVTKTFTDMKYLERIHEREAFQKGRNLSNDDIMEEKTSWKPLMLVDIEGQITVEYGKNSKEKDIQAIRQKGTLQPLYFHKSMIPDSPLEPDVETHTYVEPTIIPLEDVTGNQDNISDFRNMPWPEPRGNAPPNSSNNVSAAPIFPPNMAPFPNQFPGAQFPGLPNFPGVPPMMPGDWPNGVPPLIPNGMPGPMPPAGMPPGPVSMPPANMPPGMMVPPENMMMGPDMFGGPNQMFPIPPDGFNMQQNMFPDFNMGGPHGPPGPDGFPVPGNFRGPMRGRGAGGHWRGKAAGNWDNSTQRGRGGGRGGVRKAVCIYFQRKGSCRQGDNCTFLHPGVNCPF
ncbi:serine/threonine-protein phosphatase 1 regulatory subunit 10 [Leptidea sinapis]|uniref:serine/threonine-protein phosphatase 1 regulatory subunit 10 n=1 Tax=Leptidea sinapis TaxID=189913 RepID=UPI002137A8FD|nr:serine/threonine-protein phosphatase 1 regulatory subunit 10 [Leptidea sinapis]